jgi:DNA modification methylase
MATSRFQLSQGDAVSWLRGLSDASVDLAITDPPYESLEKHRAIGTTTRLKHSKASSNDWFAIFPNRRFEELFVELYRVLRKNSHLYLFCDPTTMFVAKPIAEAAGFRFWKPLIWDKCLGPETPVWSSRGVLPLEQLRVGDQVAVPEGGLTRIRAVRATRAPALSLQLSDGVQIVSSLDHRFALADGSIVEARDLAVGAALATRPVKETASDRLRLEPVRVVGVTPLGERDLIDVSIEHPDELFLLGNGIVTHNCKIGMGYHYRARYECILFFEKGKRKLRDLGVPDILEVPRVHRGYPAEKPVAVSRILVEQSSEPGQLVIDPFMGSGSAGVAAAMAGRSFAGNDLCAEAIDIARARLEEAGAIFDRELLATEPGPRAGVQLGLSLPP